MSYTLKSIKNPDFFICEDEYWESLLAIARDSGWKAEGTHYDLTYQVDDLFDEESGTMSNLFMVVMATQCYFSWDGNYVDRENQYLSDEDAYYLREALIGAIHDLVFLDFLEKGGFRICSI